MSEITWLKRSYSLGMETSVNIILPDSFSEASPLYPDSAPILVYLLHGLGGNGTQWRRFTTIEYAATKYGAIVVAADAGRSFYQNKTVAWSDFWTRELPEWVHSTFCLPEKIQTHLLGISMGGYGALRLASLAPQNYQGIASLSPALDRKLLVEGCEEESFVLAGEGSDFPWPESDSLESMILKNKEQWPRTLLLCGEYDPFLPSAQQFVAWAKESSLPLEAFYEPGDHAWPYWEVALKRALKFFRQDDYKALDY